MDRELIERLVYDQMYTFKYMLDKKYTFNEYVNTVAVNAGKEIENKTNEKRDEKLC